MGASPSRRCRRRPPRCRAARSKGEGSSAPWRPPSPIPRARTARRAASRCLRSARGAHHPRLTARVD
eukprot:6279053-Pyramimonas_sp.AAC.1